MARYSEINITRIQGLTLFVGKLFSLSALLPTVQSSYAILTGMMFLCFYLPDLQAGILSGGWPIITVAKAWPGFSAIQVPTKTKKINATLSRLLRPGQAFLPNKFQ
jgi:hypothetical protein